MSVIHLATRRRFCAGCDYETERHDNAHACYRCHKLERFKALEEKNRELSRYPNREK